MRERIVREAAAGSWRLFGRRRKERTAKRGRVNGKELLFKALFLLCAAFGAAAVVVIVVYLLAQGVPAMAEIGLFRFLFGTQWNPAEGQFGIFPMIVNSLYVTALSVLFGVGVGVFAAVFLSRFCPKKLYKPLRQIVNLLAGIPSVVYGFFGMNVLVPLFSGLSSSGMGEGLAVSALILGVMLLPTVVSVSLNSLNSVPAACYEGALALGATPEQAVFRVVVPAAKNGILAGAILGVGRAIGETMAIVMVSGNLPRFAASLFEGMRTLTGNIVLEMSYATGLHLGALVATGVVLFAFVLLVTICFHAFAARGAGRDKREKSRKLIAGGAPAVYTVRRGATKTLKAVSACATALTVFFLGAIVAFVLVKGLPHLSPGFVFGAFSYGGPLTMLPALLTTLMLVGLTLVVAVPVGVCAAIYLGEYAKRGGKLVKAIRSGVETLAGIPSILYGLFGMLLFVRGLGLGYSIAAGSFTLILMVLPTVIRTAEEALRDVPDAYREGSLALGAGKTRTIFRVVLPSAVSGIVSGVILSVGRIVGESAAVIFTVGSTTAMPGGFGSSGISLAVYMYILAGEGLHVNEAYAVAVVLLLFVALLNFAASAAETRLKKKVVKHG